MSTTLTEDLEEELQQQRDTGNGVPEWAAGYAMAVPCIVEGCPEDIAWWGNQHGCVKGHSCDLHTMKYIAFLRSDLSLHGYIFCNRCKQKFYALEDFFTAVRI